MEPGVSFLVKRNLFPGSAEKGKDFIFQLRKFCIILEFLLFWQPYGLSTYK